MNTRDFEHIAQLLRPRLLDVGRQFFGDHATAEDIAQETLLRLWLISQRIDPQVGVESLAVRIAKNLCVSEWRKRKLRTTGNLRQETPTDRDIQQQIEADEALQRLRQAVSHLKPAEQRLFRMRHELEMDIGDISAVTGIGARSISAMLSTAKRKLQAILTQKGGSL